MPGRGGLEKLSCEQDERSQNQNSVLNTTGTQQSDRVRCRRAGSHRDGREQQSLHCWHRNCHLKWPARSLRMLFKLPFFSGFFFDAGLGTHNVAPAHHIGKAKLVVIRRIKLVKRVPVMAPGILRPQRRSLPSTKPVGLRQS